MTSSDCSEFAEAPVVLTFPQGISREVQFRWRRKVEVPSGFAQPRRREWTGESSLYYSFSKCLSLWATWGDADFRNWRGLSLVRLLEIHKAHLYSGGPAGARKLCLLDDGILASLMCIDWTREAPLSHFAESSVYTPTGYSLRCSSLSSGAPYN